MFHQPQRSMKDKALQAEASLAGKSSMKPLFNKLLNWLVSTTTSSGTSPNPPFKSLLKTA
jgi:hypothetical protein